MSMTHVVGVDPGLVDTGAISLKFDRIVERVYITHGVIPVPTAQELRLWVNAIPGPWTPRVYVEQYRPRQRLNTDVRMLELEQRIRHIMPGAVFITNMGIKRVVTEDLMRVLQVWNWKTATHHQDLRSAARIALLGMMKDPLTNEILADVVRDHIEGRTWEVHHV
jgi:hypothetical protein